MSPKFLFYARHSAVAVQRLFRGYLGKLRFREALTQQQRIERQKFFNFSATQIQKLYGRVQQSFLLIALK